MASQRPACWLLKLVIANDLVSYLANHAIYHLAGYLAVRQVEKMAVHQLASHFVNHAVKHLI